MREVEALPGDHITEACEKLAKSAPAFMMFNDVRLEAQPGVAAGDLVAHFHAEMRRLSDAAAAKRKAFEATDEGKRQLAEAARAKDEEEKARVAMLARIAASGVRTSYPWAPGMREISGFGGGYEDACQDMLYAGLMLLENTSGRVPDAELESALLAVCPGCSGAMFGATSGAVRFIEKNSWDKYVAAMSKGDRK